MSNEKIRIKIYVNKSALSLNTIKSLKNALKDVDYKLEIIDITKHPEKAEKENILAIPTIIKKLPLPIRKIIGQLIDREKILFGLDIVDKKIKVI
jgi:circadian clock protein KaiB